jgi:hypothetical protein
MAIAKSLNDASQGKERNMYEDNLAEFLKDCDGEEKFCSICLCILPDDRVVHNCCEICEESLVAAIQDC